MFVNWCASSQQEDFLAELGVSWNVVEVTIKEIDLATSRENKARPREPRVAKVVAGLKADMQEGFKIPRPVAYKSPTGFVLTDGNQRLYAFEELITEGVFAADTPIWIYLLDQADRLVCKYATLSFV